MCIIFIRKTDNSYNQIKELNKWIYIPWSWIHIVDINSSQLDLRLTKSQSKSQQVMLWLSKKMFLMFIWRGKRLILANTTDL